MRSGSPAEDGGGWPSAQRPHSDEATSSPVRYGSGPGSDPHDGSGGRREVPFGPEISWPYGFRQLDSESREVLESAYDTGPVYSQPAVDDYGYGDPGYADPSYDGPRTPYRQPSLRRPSFWQPASGGPASGSTAFGGQRGGPANAAAPRPSGGPGYRSPEAGLARVPRPLDPRFGTVRARGPRLPAAGLPAVIRRPGDLAGDRRPGSAARHRPPAYRTADAPPARMPAAPAAPRRQASPAYPDQWYDNPRMNDQVLVTCGTTAAPWRVALRQRARVRLIRGSRALTTASFATTTPPRGVSRATTSRLTMSRGTRN